MSMGPLYILLGEVSIQVFFPFFYWAVCLPGIESYEFFIYLIYFGDETIVQCIIDKYVLPYSQFPFYLNDDFFLAMQKIFHLMESHLLLGFFFLYFSCPRKYIGKNIAT